jgi:hypothetical protein
MWWLYAAQAVAKYKKFAGIAKRFRGVFHHKHHGRRHHSYVNAHFEDVPTEDQFDTQYYPQDDGQQYYDEDNQ